jgi:alpha-tubulin suppressor-like RCC1 family protein
MTMKLRYSRSFGWCMLAMVLAGTVLMTGCQMPFDTMLLEELKQQGDLPAATAIPAISAGDAHTVALKSDGNVWAWGDNYRGQLGDDTTDDSTTPLPVLNLSGIVTIAAGGSHTVALKSDGSVWAWGLNSYGQLGDNSTLDKHTPVQVKGMSGNGWLSDVATVAGGINYIVALKSDGSVWAWGYNYSGQLGDDSTIDRHTPVPVSGLSSGVTAIAAGGSHTVALKSDGSVWAWGYNYYGQLGDNTTIDRHTPVPVSNLSSGVVAIAVGEKHTVALKNDGSVWAWGRNFSGQLGDDSTIDRHTPVPVSNLSSGVTAIAAGRYHTVALKSNSSVWAWGSNGDGQLGDGTRTSSNIPVLTIALFRL